MTDVLTSTLEELKALIVERTRPMAELVLAAHRRELEDLPRDEGTAGDDTLWAAASSLRCGHWDTHLAPYAG